MIRFVATFFTTNLMTAMISCFVSTTVFAETTAEGETIYLDETFISGNQELPKVLYILPWKNQSSGAVPAVQPKSSMERVMTLLTPHEYRMELSWRSRISDQQLARTKVKTESKTQLKSDSKAGPENLNNNSSSIDSQAYLDVSLHKIEQTQSILKED